MLTFENVLLSLTNQDETRMIIGTCIFVLYNWLCECLAAYYREIFLANDPCQECQERFTFRLFRRLSFHIFGEFTYTSTSHEQTIQVSYKHYVAAIKLHMSSVWRPTRCGYSRILASKSDALCDMCKWCIISRPSSTSYYTQFPEDTSPGVLSTTLMCRYSNVCWVFKCKNENGWMTPVHWSILQMLLPSPIMPILIVHSASGKKEKKDITIKYKI